MGESISLSLKGLEVAQQITLKRLKKYKLPKPQTVTRFIEEVLAENNVTYALEVDTELEKAFRYNVNFNVGLPFQIYARILNDRVWQVGCYFHPQYLVPRFDFADYFDETGALGEDDRIPEYYVNGRWEINLKWRSHYSHVKSSIREIVSFYAKLNL